MITPAKHELYLRTEVVIKIDGSINGISYVVFGVPISQRVNTDIWEVGFEFRQGSA